MLNILLSHGPGAGHREESPSGEPHGRTGENVENTCVSEVVLGQLETDMQHKTSSCVGGMAVVVVYQIVLLSPPFY